MQANDAFLTEVASHLILAGGKRVRPALAIAAAAAASSQTRPVPHDDVIMRRQSRWNSCTSGRCTTTTSSTRRRPGAPSRASTPGGATSRRSSPATSCWPRPRRSRHRSAPRSRVCSRRRSVGCARARSLELQHAFDVDRTEQSYFASIDGKTASLFATACRIGAHRGRPAPCRTSTRSPSSGCDYGMAFQIVDDMLDVVATDGQLGKPAGHDLVEGVYTLAGTRDSVARRGRGRRAPRSARAGRSRAPSSKRRSASSGRTGRPRRGGGCPRGGRRGDRRARGVPSDPRSRSARGGRTAPRLSSFAVAEVTVEAVTRPRKSGAAR